MTTKKRSVGQPLKNINWEQAARLAEINCTEAEIAHVLGVTRRTLQNRCVKDQQCKVIEFINRNNLCGKASLRRLMFEKAEGRETEFARDPKTKAILLNDKSKPIILNYGFSPDTTMQIFLSKNLLGYADKQEITGKDGAAVVSHTTINVVSQAAKTMLADVIAGKGTETSGDENKPCI